MRPKLVYGKSNSSHHKKTRRTDTSTQAAKKSKHVIRQPGQLESIHPPSCTHLRLLRDLHRYRGPSAFGMRNNVERDLRRAPISAAARIVRSAPRPHERRVRTRTRVLLHNVRTGPEFVSGTFRTRRIVRPRHAPAVLSEAVDVIAHEVLVLS